MWGPQAHTRAHTPKANVYLLLTLRALTIIGHFLPTYLAPQASFSRTSAPWGRGSGLLCSNRRHTVGT